MVSKAGPEFKATAVAKVFAAFKHSLANKGALGCKVARVDKDVAAFRVVVGFKVDMVCKDSAACKDWLANKVAWDAKAVPDYKADVARKVLRA
jgi:hypothetical protein